MDYRNYNRGYAEPAMSASDYMTRTYRWMASGLLITFAMAYITATTPLLYLVDSLYLVLTIAELALVFVLSSRVQTMSVQGARATFFVTPWRCATASNWRPTLTRGSISGCSTKIITASSGGRRIL